MHFFPTLSPSFYDTFRAFTKLDHTGSFDLSVLQADSEEKLDPIIFFWILTSLAYTANILLVKKATSFISHVLSMHF